jgi:hypothetical protein
MDSDYQNGDISVTKFMDTDYQNGDISVTKFLRQDDNIAIDQDDHMLMIEFLEHDQNAKFLDSTMARYLQ